MTNRLFLLVCSISLVFALTLSSAEAQYGYKSSKSKTSTTRSAGSGTSSQAEEEETLAPAVALSQRLIPDAMRILMEPTDVECFAVKKKAYQAEKPSFLGLELQGMCGVLSKSALTEVQHVLFGEAEKYDFIKPMKCVFNPKVALRFSRGVDHVDILISPKKCVGLKYYYADRHFTVKTDLAENWLTRFTDGVRADMVPVKLEEVAPLSTLKKKEEKRQWTTKESAPKQRWKKTLDRSW